MKMEIFEYSWSDFEASCTLLLIHENKTKEEFKEDCKFLLNKYFDEYLQQEDCWASIGRLSEFIESKFSELGYTKPIINSFRISGGELIDEDCSKDHFVQIIGEENFKKALIIT